MTEIKELDYIVNNSILNKIFESREEDLCSLSEKDKKSLKEILSKSKSFKDVLSAIDNIPECFIETRKLITDAVEEHVDKINLEKAYENEKFYKCGFVDGVNLIIDCIVKK